jgi:hypothetical protein
LALGVDERGNKVDESGNEYEEGNEDATTHVSP